ncbi:MULTISPECIES: hypothetical protein [unclassified Thioalkalivibrio]|uniref:DUF7673 family protein n=1 Tax=unclassified Thioalkalivibrio TaxID=2621013 RepID=UPI00036832CB|nr:MULTISPECIES: hypothetical protein [unclassified Thioalkalivibrio]
MPVPRIATVDADQALDRLLLVALGRSGQSRSVRRVVLACYNAPEWPLDLSDLRGLDPDLQASALTAIRLFMEGSDLYHHRPEAPWQTIWDLACQESEGGDRTR